MDKGWGVLKIRQFYGRNMCIVRKSFCKCEKKTDDKIFSMFISFFFTNFLQTENEIKKLKIMYN